MKPLKIKKANRTSRRYDRLPLLPSGPGGVRRELAVPIRQCKYTTTCCGVQYLLR
jgi:hypothetical protein